MLYLCQGEIVRKQRFFECNKNCREIGREEERERDRWKVFVRKDCHEMCVRWIVSKRIPSLIDSSPFHSIPYDIFADGPILYDHLLPLSIFTISVCPDASVFVILLWSAHYLPFWGHPPQLFILFVQRRFPPMSSSLRIITNTISM